HVSDIKVPSKPEEKSQGPIDSVKPSLKEYSDDESDEDFDSSKPLDKQTPLIAPLVGPGEKSPVKTDEKPKPVELKDSTKPDEKRKVPIVSETASPREYSDDESDEDLDIPKPQDKPAGQPTPLITPLIGTGEKSPVKDDLKPQPVTTFKAEESLTTIQSAAKSVSTVVSITGSHISDIKVPSKPEEKPQGPIDSVKPSLKEYSDDESDEDFDSSKPLDKQTPLIAPLVGPGEKSPVKTDEKPKPVELKDSTKPDEKRKVPIV
ncbi:uncharacterized protein Dana_GF28015, partial [Drosophila ananassae]